MVLFRIYILLFYLKSIIIIYNKLIIIIILGWFEASGCWGVFAVECHVILCVRTCTGLLFGVSRLNRLGEFILSRQQHSLLNIIWVGDVNSLFQLVSNIVFEILKIIYYLKLESPVFQSNDQLSLVILCNCSWLWIFFYHVPRLGENLNSILSLIYPSQLADFPR